MLDELASVPFWKLARLRKALASLSSSTDLFVGDHNLALALSGLNGGRPQVRILQPLAGRPHLVAANHRYAVAAGEANLAEELVRLTAPLSPARCVPILVDLPGGYVAHALRGILSRLPLDLDLAQLQRPAVTVAVSAYLPQGRVDGRTLFAPREEISSALRNAAWQPLTEGIEFAIVDPVEVIADHPLLGSVRYYPLVEAFGGWGAIPESPLAVGSADGRVLPSLGCEGSALYFFPSPMDGRIALFLSGELERELYPEPGRYLAVRARRAP